MQQARDGLGAMYGIESSVLATVASAARWRRFRSRFAAPDVAELQASRTRRGRDEDEFRASSRSSRRLGDPKPEVRLDIEVDRANDLGLDVSPIAVHDPAPPRRGDGDAWEDPTGEEHDVVVQAPARRAYHCGGHRAACRSPPAGPTVLPSRFRSATSRRSRQAWAPAQIDRKDLERVATIGANWPRALTSVTPRRRIQPSVAALRAARRLHRSGSAARRSSWRRRRATWSRRSCSR